MINLTEENKHYVKRAVTSRGMINESDYINALLDHLRKREADKRALPNFWITDFNK